jgi:orotate phosphoribosyltransferase
VKDLRDAGFEVVGVMAIFTYEFQVATDNFKNAKCKFATLSNYTTMLAEAESANYITKEDKEVLSQWSKNPKEWYDNNF